MVVQISVVVGLAVVVDTVVLVVFVWGLLVVEHEVVDLVVEVEGIEVELVHLVEELDV